MRLELYNLPDNWEWAKIGDFAKLLRGVSYKKDDASKTPKTGYLPILRANNINNVLNFDELIYVPSEKIKPEQIISDGDILISMSSGSKHLVGKTAQADKDYNASFGAFCGLIRINDEVDKTFIKFFFKSQNYRKIISHLSEGININNLRREYIESMPIPLPPLETQNKIVEILENAEKLKQWRTEADELSDDYLDSAFHSIFGDPIKNEEKWEVKKLSDIADVVSGVTKGRKLQNKETVFAPYLRVANVQDGYLDLDEIKEIEVLTTDVEKYKLFEGDIVLTEGGDPDKLGRGAVWHNEVPNCIHQNHIFRVRLKNGDLSPIYLSKLIGSLYGKLYFLKSAKQTTGIASINSTQLKKFPVIIPPIELQNQFIEIVKQVETLKYYQSQSKQEVDNLFNILMQKAFKGELVC